MAILTKGVIVLFALRKAGLASTTVLLEPEPQAVMDGLEDLEAMVATMRSDGLDIPYIFSAESVPNPDEDTGLDLAHKMPLGFLLAQQMLIDNLRPVTDDVAGQALNGKLMLSALYYKPHYLQRRNDQPMGQGNDKNADVYNRFAIQATTEEGGGF